MIPDSVEVLHIGGFNKPLAAGVVHEGVTVLHIGRKYEHALGEGVIPSSVKQLCIHGAKIRKSVIPNSVKGIWTGNLAVLKVVHQWIPSSVTFLRIVENDDSAGHFIQPVPDSVQTLVHGHRIQNGAIPNSVTTMMLLSKFNKPLAAGVLPDSLTSIKFGTRFNQQLSPGVLPDSLKRLELGTMFNRILLPDCLPRNLVNLEFGLSYNQPLLIGTLPSSLRTVRFGSAFNQPLYRLVRAVDMTIDGSQDRSVNRDSNGFVSINLIPYGVKCLYLPIGYNCAIPVECLPPTITNMQGGHAQHYSHNEKDVIVVDD